MTGLVYARARWYDPSTGTFLSPDPLGYRDSSNLYAFGAGDPVNNRDPLGEGILDDLRFAAGQYYTDVATRAAVTGNAIKGIATSVVKTVVGTAAAANLIHEASKVGNIQAQMQLVDAVVGTHDAVAQWGTSAGQVIGEPELIGQISELHPDEFAEEITDATILTASFITPAAKAKAPARGLTRPTPAQMKLHERINARARLAEYRASLPTRNAPSTPAGQYQSRVLNAATEYQASGGGVTYWTDDIRLFDFSLRDAKMIPNPGRSPSIPGSAMPPRFRNVINAKVEGEFERIGLIINDPANELRMLRVVTSDPRAVSFWEELMQRYAIPGRVVVNP